ncbi:hypothetical protein CLUG_05379 [Clavispora lusitaniae ATCC 42720]|uniref:Uncharacterized protein n=1 Tax=Clavispora lusitaniae (strain ATCC 42720) TaxID=306902 RepID=C4YB87_CLAL4|nr:uncharacterized protein CLUG_05379 [Clavispora lusitaniae ATCC 42720]EEQ41252.1 hypothetical protein CLUG_05379 [Clavispora lusitaniae ATCC 42720]
MHPDIDCSAIAQDVDSGFQASGSQRLELRETKESFAHKLFWILFCISTYSVRIAVGIGQRMELHKCRIQVVGQTFERHGHHVINIAKARVDGNGRRVPHRPRLEQCQKVQRKVFERVGENQSVGTRAVHVVVSFAHSPIQREDSHELLAHRLAQLDKQLFAHKRKRIAKNGGHHRVSVDKTEDVSETFAHSQNQVDNTHFAGASAVCVEHGGSEVAVVLCVERAVVLEQDGEGQVFREDRYSRVQREADQGRFARRETVVSGHSQAVGAAQLESASVAHALLHRRHESVRQGSAVALKHKGRPLAHDSARDGAEPAKVRHVCGGVGHGKNVQADVSRHQVLAQKTDVLVVGRVQGTLGLCQRAAAHVSVFLDARAAGAPRGKRAQKSGDFASAGASQGQRRGADGHGQTRLGRAGRKSLHGVQGVLDDASAVGGVSEKTVVERHERVVQVARQHKSRRVELGREVEDVHAAVEEHDGVGRGIGGVVAVVAVAVAVAVAENGQADRVGRHHWQSPSHTGHADVDQKHMVHGFAAGLVVLGHSNVVDAAVQLGPSRPVHTSARGVERRHVLERNVVVAESAHVTREAACGGVGHGRVDVGAAAVAARRAQASCHVDCGHRVLARSERRKRAHRDRHRQVCGAAERFGLGHRVQGAAHVARRGGASVHGSVSGACGGRHHVSEREERARGVLGVVGEPRGREREAAGVGGRGHVEGNGTTTGCQTSTGVAGGGWSEVVVGVCVGVCVGVVYVVCVGVVYVVCVGVVCVVCIVWLAEAGCLVGCLVVLKLLMFSLWNAGLDTSGIDPLGMLIDGSAKVGTEPVWFPW